MSTPDTYEIYAIKYAHHARRASENFLGGDPHDGPMPIDFFVWAIVGENAGEKQTFVVDTGFNPAMARKRTSTSRSERRPSPPTCPASRAFWSPAFAAINRRSRSNRR